MKYFNEGMILFKNNILFIFLLWRRKKNADFDNENCAQDWYIVSCHIVAYYLDPDPYLFDRSAPGSTVILEKNYHGSWDTSGWLYAVAIFKPIRGTKGRGMLI
jgi:hypothetical protein